MYEESARDKLREKLAYELWVLRFLLDPIEPNASGRDPGRRIFTNRQAGAIVELGALIVMFGAKRALRVVDAMRPLMFVACYKTLDMIFEWILEENCAARNIGRVPWRFAEKIPELRALRPGWFPAVMQSNPYLRDYLIALFEGLSDYRNEIVHGDSFALSGQTLTIGPTKTGKPALVLDSDELSVLTKVALAAAHFVTGDADFGHYEGQLFRHRLDRIEKCHARPQFADPEPVLENVVLKVPAEAGAFPADLAWLREQVARPYPGKTVFFNLEVLGTVEGEPQCAWRFPYDEVPEDEVCEFRPGSHGEYAVSLTDIRPP